MPRTPRNPGSGKKPFNGCANGAGWGGAAKGTGGDRPAEPFAQGNPGGPGDGAGRGSKPTYASLARAERVERLKELLWDIATDGASETNRVNAAEKLLDREEGKPIQRQITGDLGDLSGITDEEIDARIAAAEAKLRSAA